MNEPKKAAVEPLRTRARAFLMSRRVRMAVRPRERAAAISSKRAVVGMLIVAGAAVLIWTMVAA